MKYTSTRGEYTASAAQAIAYGIAPNGGLYTPTELPEVTLEELSSLKALSYSALTADILSRFLSDFTKEELSGFASAAYDSGRFLRPGSQDREAVGFMPLASGEDLLALYYGPTAAFKDMALQIMPRLLTASLKKLGEKRTVCILVATSGDTGKAALEGFADVPGTRIFVFYPSGGVSDIQRLQMVTQRGGNVGVCAVKGNFDDAQTGVKRIFGDAAFAEEISRRGFFLSSANSINWGRLLPQIVYYFSAYCDYVNSGNAVFGDEIVFCVPTGNFGNILAGWFAKQMGLPVKRFVCASNANDVLTEFIHTGVYNKNRPFHLTISPSMDILVSSNLERLLYMLCGDRATTGYMKQLAETGCYDVGKDVRAKIAAQFSAACCDDAGTCGKIAQVWKDYAYLIDTHTAVAARVLDAYRAETGDETPAVIVSTASPFKFAADVCGALGTDKQGDPLRALSDYCGIPVPAPLSGLEAREVRFDGVTEKANMLRTVDEFLR